MKPECLDCRATGYRQSSPAQQQGDAELEDARFPSLAGDRPGHVQQQERADSGDQDSTDSPDLPFNGIRVLDA